MSSIPLTAGLFNDVQYNRFTNFPVFVFLNLHILATRQKADSRKVDRQSTEPLHVTDHTQPNLILLHLINITERPYCISVPSMSVWPIFLLPRVCLNFVRGLVSGQSQFSVYFTLVDNCLKHARIFADRCTIIY